MAYIILQQIEIIIFYKIPENEKITDGFTVDKMTEKLG